MTQLGLAKLGDSVQVVWSKSTSLQLFNQVKEFLNVGHLQRDIGLTDTTLSVNGRIASIETGKLLQKVEGATIRLMPNMAI